MTNSGVQIINVDCQVNPFNNVWPFLKRFVDKLLHVNLKNLFGTIIAELEEDVRIILNIHSWYDFLARNFYF